MKMKKGMYLLLGFVLVVAMTVTLTNADKRLGSETVKVMSLDKKVLQEVPVEPYPEGFARAFSGPMDWPDEYNLYRSDSYFESIGDADLIASIPFGTERYVDTDVDSLVYYFYRATAVYGDSESVPSNLDSGYSVPPSPTPINPPQGVYATDVNFGQVDVYWAAPTVLVGDEIYYDSGIPYLSLGYGSAGNGLAVRFTPPPGGCTLLGLRFMFTNISDGLSFEVHVWDDGPGANLVTPIIAPINVPTIAAVWVDVPTPEIFIDNDFFGGWIELAMGTPYVAADTSDPDDRSWVYTSGEGWSVLSDFSGFEYHDLIIRAVIETEDGRIMALRPTPIYSEPKNIGHTSLVNPSKGSPITEYTGHPEATFLMRPLTAPMELLEYNIYRNDEVFTETSEGELLGTVPAESLHYIDADVVPGEWYFYGITSVFDDGESELSPIDSGQATSTAPPAQVLIYDYDGGDILADEGTNDEADVIISVLADLGYTDVYRSMEDENLSRYNLRDYQAIIVITGAYPNPPPISDEDLDSIVAYLEDGGSIYFEGVDLGWDYLYDGSAAGSTFFDIFHISWDDDGYEASTGNVEYIQGTSVYFGEGITVDYDYQMTADHYVDEISAAGAGLILTDQDGTGRGSRYYSTIHGYKAIYSAVYLGGMHDDIEPNNRATILSAYMEDMVGEPTGRFRVAPMETFEIELNPRYRLATTTTVFPPLNLLASEGMFNQILVTWHRPAFIPPEGDSIELKWDDGVIDTVTTGSGSFSYLYATTDPGDGLLVKFMPPYATDVLIGARFYLGTEVPFEVNVWEESMGEPGDPIMAPFMVDPDITGEWFDVSLPNIELDGHNFFVGFRNLDFGGVSIGVDNSSVDPYSWVVISDTFWSLEGASSPFNEIDLMIRALVSSTEGIVREIKPVPANYCLGAAYPNPFNPITKISFAVPQRENIELAVYDILGQKLEILHQGITEPGSFIVEWDATDMPSGVYFYRLTTPQTVRTEKMILMK
ncbi:T9SS type A sorting domain-containing protein [bacterium]|nr:T9SS type A sorting domain-containing protein [bacterium]